MSNFFRDPALYDKLEKDILPRIFARKRGEDSDVRVWSVGCATGEETYSLAILLFEEAARHDSPPRLQVFASDLHEDLLRRARDGFYPGDIENDVNATRIRRFFLKQEGGHRIRKEMREIVVFASHNLDSDPPFSRLDLIICRDLLSYLECGAHKELDRLFHYALRPDGILVVRGAEAVVRSELFLPEDKKAGVYRRRDVPTPGLPVFPAHRKHIPGREVMPETGDGHVSTGADGLEQARSWQPQVALIDLGLPDLPGYEVARRIQQEQGRRTLLLAVTGFGDSLARDQALQAGFVERLVKPIDLGRLRALIAAHVGRKPS